MLTDSQLCFYSDGLLAALEVAFQFDTEVVVESAVLQVVQDTAFFYTVPLTKNDTLMQGVEVSCTVHDITTDDLLEAFPVTEITPGYV
jgi:hypothetical protein